CNDLAKLYETIGDFSNTNKERLDMYQKAELFYIEVKEIRGKIFGIAHPYYKSSCKQLEVFYENQNKQLKTTKTEKQDENLDINLALSYYESKQYKQAALQFEKAIPLIEKTYGKKDTSIYSKLLLYTAVSFEQYLNYTKAEKYYLQCNAVYQSINATLAPDYAICCGSFAELYRAMGNYKKAEQLNIEARKIYKKVLGKENLYYATNCNNLALLYDNMGDLQKAEPLYIEARKIYKKVSGKQHPDYVINCNNLALLYDKMGNYKKAELFYIEVKEISGKTLGTEHPDYKSSCKQLAEFYESHNKQIKTTKTEKQDENLDINLALDYYESKQYKQAALEFEKVIPSIEKKYGENDTSIYVEVLFLTAECFIKSRDYDKAEKYYLACNSVYQGINSIQSLKYAKNCNKLASLYFEMGGFASSSAKKKEYYLKAIPLFKVTNEIIESKFGKKYPDYITNCGNLASIYYEINNFKQSLHCYLEVQELIESVFGNDNIAYARTCNDLAVFYKRTGNYKNAEQQYLLSKKIHEKSLGKNHNLYSINSSNLGLLYTEMGKYQEAEALLLKALVNDEKNYGKAHSFYADMCNNLGLLYAKIGNYKKAESYFLDAKKIREKVFGKHHPDYASICNNLASLYSDMKNYEPALSLYTEAYKIRKLVLGKEDPDYATTCDNIATLYFDIGSLYKNKQKQTEAYQKAKLLFVEAKEIRANILGKGHPDYNLTCNNLAVLYSETNNYQQAEALFIEVKNNDEKFLGKKHPSYAESCNNLALLYESVGNYQKAETFFLEANEIMNSLTVESAKFMSEKERELFLSAKISYNYDGYHSFYLSRREENKKLVALVYNNALNTKGQLLKSSVAVRKAVLQSGDTTLVNTYNQMNTYGEILTRQYTLPIEKRRSDIKQLEEKVNTLEKELIRISSSLSGFKTLTGIEPNWQNIQKSLKPDETAIEFIHFRYRSDKKWTDSTFYYALILRKDYIYPKAVFLFEETQLQKLLEREEGGDDFNYVKRLYSSSSAQSDSLYNLVFKPIEKYLTGTKTMYVSPTGLLNRIAFDALTSDSTTILSDKYNIYYTSTTAANIKQTGLFQKDIENAVLFGGIEYDIDPDKMRENAHVSKEKIVPESSVLIEPSRPTNSLNRGMLDGLTRNVSWNYLEGSLKETEEIQDVIQKENVNVTLYKEELGSEELFKALENDAPSILHVSTHGFYFGDDKKSNEYKDMIDKDVKFAHSDKPLLRSGFILAGGNAAFQGKTIPKGVEDGVLTALEISRLNFFNTKLAVLSACQTGLGDVKGSEGVYGLQRAFKMAGVEYLLFSLWEVPDYQTRELMTN
ncbi:MAG: hypothetical protein DRJ10_08310, partial [Bacteroidetes bacterium]